VHEFIERHLLAEYRQRDTWLYVANSLDKAARGGDINDVVASLRLMLQLRAEQSPGVYEPSEAMPADGR
jgi:hypothetical protein